MAAEGSEFELGGAGGVTLRGEEQGEGPAVILAHGLTAHRNLVVHGSRVLAREGLRMVTYDARGHGESDPGERGSYDYQHLAGDLAAVIDSRGGEQRPVLCGHSMGAHTIVALALRDPDALAGVVLIGPASAGENPSQGSLKRWDALAEGLEREGVEGFIEAYDNDLDPEWRETLLRIARERLERHRHLQALAHALREVPRSRPFERLAALESLDLPALVVASHDSADPGHPYAVAEDYAERLPRARLVSEGEGESPLAWQGGRLSREIAAFCGEDAVAERRMY